MVTSVTSIKNTVCFPENLSLFNSVINWNTQNIGYKYKHHGDHFLLASKQSRQHNIF
jgi:hypothetical protein